MQRAINNSVAAIEAYPQLMIWVIRIWTTKIKDGSPVWDDNEAVCELSGMEKAVWELRGDIRDIDLIDELNFLQAIKEV